MNRQTERLILRRLQLSDAAVVQQLCDNEHIYNTTLYIPSPYTYADALQWISRSNELFNAQIVFTFALTLHDGTFIGTISLSHNAAFKHGELAYWIGQPFWNNGYATEAAHAIVRFAFDELSLHKVYARYFASNPASGKILEKIGMTQEGILRDHVMKNGRYEHLVCCGMLNVTERGIG